MSAKKRRAKRKLALLVKMDQQAGRYWLIPKHRGTSKRERLLAGELALGRKLTRMGLRRRAILAIIVSRPFHFDPPRLPI